MILQEATIKKCRGRTSQRKTIKNPVIVKRQITGQPSPIAPLIPPLRDDGEAEAGLTEQRKSGV
jgi:hypothetical protein